MNEYVTSTSKNVFDICEKIEIVIQNSRTLEKTQTSKYVEYWGIFVLFCIIYQHKYFYKL